MSVTTTCNIKSIIENFALIEKSNNNNIGTLASIPNINIVHGRRYRNTYLSFHVPLCVITTRLKRKIRI